LDIQTLSIIPFGHFSAENIPFKNERKLQTLPFKPCLLFCSDTFHPKIFRLKMKKTTNLAIQTLSIIPFEHFSAENISFKNE